MQTFIERRKQLHKMLKDQHLETFEGFKLVWHFYALERAFALRAKADKLVEKHGERFNNDIEILNARNEMADL